MRDDVRARSYVESRQRLFTDDPDADQLEPRGGGDLLPLPNVPFVELIWSYWMEEGMLVQSMNHIVARFQNRRIRGGDALLELEADGDVLTADRAVATGAPDHFAIDGGSGLLTITGRFLGQLEDDGAPSKAIPLPVEGMRLAASTTKGKVYLYGGSTARRLYSLTEDGALEIVAIGRQGVARRPGLGGEHVEEAVDQRAVFRAHVRASASAAIIRAV